MTDPRDDSPPPQLPQVGRNGPGSAVDAIADLLPPPVCPVAATRPTPPPRPLSVEVLLDLAVAVAAFLLFSVVAGTAWSLLQIIDGLRDGNAVDAMPGPLAQILIAVCSLGPTALLLYWLRRPALPDEVTVARPGAPRTLLLAIVTGAGLMLANTGLFVALEAAGIRAVPGNFAVIEALASRHPVLLVLFVAVLAPIYEETLFRRVLFARWWTAGRAGAGIALSAALFASSHELPGLGDTPLGVACLLWLVYAGMGAVLAWLFRRTGVLWAAIVAHGVNNLLAVVVLIRAQSG